MISNSNNAYNNNDNNNDNLCVVQHYIILYILIKYLRTVNILVCLPLF